jgi:hypothetical protein
LAGLAETVTFVKEGTTAYALRADGSKEPLESAKRRNGEALRARYGALVPAFAEALDAKATEELVPIAAYFYVDVHWRDILARIQHGDEKEAAAARAELHGAISATGAGLKSFFEEQGVVDVQASTVLPLVVGQATPDTIKAIARDPRLRLIRDDYPKVPVEHSNVIAPSPFIGGDVLNNKGFSGSGQHIGVVDPGTCRFLDTHSVFSANPAHYQSTGATCTTNVDCDPPSSGGDGVCGGDGNKCVSGKCIDRHGTQVTSVIAQIAPKADIFYANKGQSVPGSTVPSVACSELGISDAYQYFVDSKVRVVNESFGCKDQLLSPSHVDGITQDYYSRVEGITVTKSGGNRESVSYERLVPTPSTAFASVASTATTRWPASPAGATPGSTSGATRRIARNPMSPHWRATAMRHRRTTATRRRWMTRSASPV